MSGLGISYTPPTETLPIFDSSVFPLTSISATTITSDPKKLDYPKAQGLETFPSGLTTSLINLSNSTPSQPIGYTITGRFPIFQTLPNQPNIDGSPQYAMNTGGTSPTQVQLLIGATYLINITITLQGTSGSYTGVGFSISLRGSIYSTQSSDWTYITSSTSQQGITAGSTNNLVFMNWSQIVYIDPAIYRIIPANTTTDVWIQVGGWSGSSAQNPTGTWTFSNIFPSYSQFTRIA
jgi:hypothetical protein